MDMLTDLPPVLTQDGIVDSMLVVVDHGLTKGVIITPCSKTLTEEGATQILLDNLYNALDSLTASFLIVTPVLLPNLSKNS